MVYAAQRDSSLLKMCWVHISVQEIVRVSLWGLLPESHPGWEMNGGCDSQGSEPDTKLKLWIKLKSDNTKKWMEAFHKMVLAGRGWTKRRQKCVLFTECGLRCWILRIEVIMTSLTDQNSRKLSLSGRMKLLAHWLCCLRGCWVLRNLFCYQEALLEVMWQGRFGVG